MTAARWAQLSPLIDAALDLRIDERAAYVDRVASTDPAMRRDLLRLLAEAERNNSLVERGAIERFALLLSERDVAPSGVLANRFEIEAEIGRGGMATVFRALDRKHDRAVAVKVMRPELAAVIGVERFHREIRTVARLQHPNILPLHDSGENDGFLYYVMPYVEGESLRDRLAREPQLPLAEALSLAREIGDALDCAHSQGIVHRDVKPENILLSRGHALVTDFGIARAVSTPDADALTLAGIFVGTPAYMSPERAAADGSVDGRADVYSLGCVLYEMLGGRPPFAGPTAWETLTLHAVEPVPSLRAIRPDVPAAVERAIEKALSKKSADRFATAAEFFAACSADRTDGARRRRRAALVVIGAGVVLAAASYAVTRGNNPERDGKTAAVAAAPSIAVLPLRNVSRDPGDEAVSDGISEEIAVAIGKIPGLNVKAPRSAFAFKSKNITIQQIGRALGVHYLIDGSLQKDGERLRVRVQLIEAANDSTLWLNGYDRPYRDIFAVQQEIARAVAGELRIRLPNEDPTDISRRSTENPQAHDLYLRGRFFFERRDSASLRLAREYFERAIASDSSYTIAYAGLSDAYSHSSVFGYARPRDAMPKAIDYAKKGFMLDSTLVEIRSSRAFISLFYDWNLRAAGRGFREAVEIDPRYASAHLWRAWYYMAADSVDSSVVAAKRAVQLEPFVPLTNTRLISLLYFGGRYPEALAQAQRTFELDSTFFQIRVERARVLMRLGRCEAALADIERVRDQPAAQLQGTRGYVYAKCGRRAAALAELDHLSKQARAGRYVSHYALAVIHSALGNTDVAFAELEAAVEEREWPMFMLKHEPAFENLRSDPRFAGLIRRVGLATISH